MGEMKVIAKGYKENPDLMPTQLKDRKYNTKTIILMFFSMNTCIPMFFLGPIGKSLGLSLTQVLVGAALGNALTALVMWLNGVIGTRYGVSYPVQLRESFGFKGTAVPLFMRGLVGLMWFGIEAFVGSLALLMIFLVIIGTPKADVLPLATRYLPIALVFYIASLIYVMRHGLPGIGVMANWAGPLLLIYFIWLVIWLAINPEFSANTSKLFISTAGYLSMGFFTYLAVQVNWWATVALNISDISRGIKPNNKTALPVGIFIGLVIGQIIGTALGYVAITLTGIVLPQEIILKFSPGIIAAIIGLSFAFIAPWSTDIVANVPAVTSLLMSLSSKFSFKKAVTATGIIAFFVAPWWAFDKAQGIVNYTTQWAANYGILLGPIAGIMIADYWIVKRQHYDVQRLYTYGSDGPWYAKGWSKAAYASLILTWIIGYLIAWATHQIAYVASVPVPGGIIWIPAVIIALLLYMIFDKKYQEQH